jgi:hypothetical protein
MEKRKTKIINTITEQAAAIAAANRVRSLYVDVTGERGLGLRASGIQTNQIVGSVKMANHPIPDPFLLMVFHPTSTWRGGIDVIGFNVDYHVAGGYLPGLIQTTADTFNAIIKGGVVHLGTDDIQPAPNRISSGLQVTEIST